MCSALTLYEDHIPLTIFSSSPLSLLPACVLSCYRYIPSTSFLVPRLSIVALLVSKVLSISALSSRSPYVYMHPYTSRWLAMDWKLYTSYDTCSIVVLHLGFGLLPSYISFTYSLHQLPPCLSARLCPLLSINAVFSLYPSEMYPGLRVRALRAYAICSEPAQNVANLFTA